MSQQHEQHTTESPIVPGWIDWYTQDLREHLVRCHCPTCDDRHIEIDDWPDPYERATVCDVIRALSAGAEWPWCENSESRVWERYDAARQDLDHERLVARLTSPAVDRYLSHGGPGDEIWGSPDV